MTVDDAIHAFATTTGKLPEAAISWAFENWDVAAPRFIERLDTYIDAGETSEQDEAALFLIIHLFGERREKRAFPVLCRLLHDAEATELILYDAVTETLRGILISTFDGDPVPLRAVIESDTADEYARDAALLAMAYLAGTGEIDGDQMHAYLMHLLAGMQPQSEHLVWVAWVMATAFLGYKDYAAEAERLFRLGWIPHEFMGVEHFRKDLYRTLADPDRMAGFESENIGPFVDAVGELSKWPAYRSDLEQAAEFPAPVKNPFKDVGRNDPCPCGSGKKYKKCCLAVTA